MNLRIVIGLAGCTLLIALPLFFGGYAIRLATLTIMWVGLATCWNLLSGYARYIDFGSVVYFGIGSYVAFLVMVRLGQSFWVALIFAAALSALIALIIGLPTLRLKGAYFAIATFAFAEAMKQVALEWDNLTGISLFGGSHGVTFPINTSSEFFYYVFLGLTTGILAATLLTERSAFGFALKAIAQDEDAAEGVGVNTARTKVQAYAISAGFLGMFGAAESYWLTYITPSSVFDVHITIQMVIMTLLGGMGTVLGPAIGATFLYLVSEMLWARFLYVYMALVGLIIIGVILFMPQGIVGSLRGRFSTHRRGA
jgi:branched-chain amino acid transport system permease protein